MLRFVLTCLLVAAIPLQCFAAVSMSACGAGPSDRVVEARGAHQGATHEAPIASMDHRSGLTATSDASRPERHGHDGGHSFAKCGACCTWTAVPSGLREFSPMPLAGFFAPFLPASVPAGVAAGLERPPRSA